MSIEETFIELQSSNAKQVEIIVLGQADSSKNIQSHPADADALLPKPFQEIMNLSDLVLKYANEIKPRVQIINIDSMGPALAIIAAILPNDITESDMEFSLLNKVMLKKTIKKLRRKYNDIFIVLMPNWGGINNWKNVKQKKIMKQWVKCGVDLIVGGGHNDLQQIDFYYGHWILSSLGVVSIESQSMPIHSYGLMLKMIVTQNQLKLRIYPFLPGNIAKNKPPCLLSEQSFNEYCKVIVAQSKEKIGDLFLKKKQNELYCIDLPAIHWVSKASDAYLGMLATIKTNTPTLQKAKYWMHRAVAMSHPLNSSSKKIIYYSFEDVDDITHEVSGYLCENEQFIPIRAPLPRINYYWASGGKTASKASSKFLNKDRFLKWAKLNRYYYLPPRIFQKFSIDKFECYKELTKVYNVHQPKTARYQPLEKILRAFLETSPRVFLKPRFGNKGQDILVLKKQNNQYYLKHYQDKDCIINNADHLNKLIEIIDKHAKRRKYIIQEGIETPVLGNHAFNIRAVMVNTGKTWVCAHEIWAGDLELDVINLSLDNSYNFPTRIFLSEFLDEDCVASIIHAIEETSYAVARHLGSIFYPELIEFSLDLLLDNEYKVHVLEINSKPGLTGTPEDFPDFVHRTKAEDESFCQYSVRQGGAIVKYLNYCHTKELFRHNIWFDDLIELTTPDEQSIHQFLTLLETSLWNKKNTLQFSTIENRPSIVFLTLFCENGQRVVLLGCGQNYDECYQSLLPSLPKDIKYVNVFVVNQVNNIIHFDIKDPLPIKVGYHGLAFSEMPRIAYLPWQLIECDLINKEDNTINKKNIDFLSELSLNTKEVYYFIGKTYTLAKDNN